MFNINLLKSTNKLYNYSRDIDPFEKYTDSSLIYYEHFINPNGYEIIILPFYTESDSIQILKKHGFVISRRNQTNERCMLAYKLDTKNTVDKLYGLVLMTLFYDETPEQLKRFYKYYIDQGVDHFFMYYNGDLAKASDSLPHKDNITYLEWDFNYWIWIEPTTKCHHAQMPALISFTKKYLPYTNFALMVDTDEFLTTDNNITIREYLDQQPSVNMFTNHCWANINFDTGNAQFYCTDAARGKSIICPEDCPIDLLPSVHKYISSPSQITAPINLLHHRQTFTVPDHRICHTTQIF